MSKAIAPSSCIGWRIVVSGGWRWRATGTSSNPVTATSCGTLIPRRGGACITPGAVWLLGQTTAGGRSRGCAGGGLLPRGDPRRHVFVVVPDRADQDVEATALRGDVDTAIDDVDEEQAFVLVFEESFVTAAKDHADDLLEAVRQSARRAVADEAELGDRLHHSLAGRGAGGPLAVQDPRDRRDRHAGAARHVVDRQGALLPFRVGHETLYAPTDGRLALLVSAYR